MAHGSTLPYIYGRSRARPAWRAALRRGAILGSVIALHLAIVALVLRPMPPYRSAHTAIHDDGRALQISFVTLPEKSRPADLPPRPLQPRTTHPATSAAPLSPSAVIPPHAVVTILPANVPDGSDDYRPALLGAGLRDAQQPPRVRLPGLDAPPRTGILLGNDSSLREVVRVMTTANRCKYVRMKMERSTTEFVTRQLVERALDADRCGPQAAHTAADATVDEIARRATFRD